MDNKNYYEVFDWAGFKDAEVNFQVVSSMIPAGVKTIIDIGCGNGLITNKLAETYSVLGVDRSSSAIAHVTCNKLQSGCDNIKVDDHSFDLVLSSELLEHLDDNTFEKTIAEFKRISGRYILISVPFEESLSKGNIQCPECKLIYHRSYHMRVFSLKSISGLFPDYSIVDYKSFGLKVRVYNSVIAKVKQSLTSASSWIPYYWTKNESRNTLCPRCENRFVYPYKFNLFSFLLDCVNVIITKKKPFHLVVLLKKN